VETGTPSGGSPGEAAIGRFSAANVGAAWWALRASWRTRWRLRRGGLDAALYPSAPPDRPAEAERGVRAALRRRGDTCLVSSIVLQSWYAAHGDPRDLIVGVTEPGDAFKAHAWLDGDSPHGDGPFLELLRRPPPTAPSRPRAPLA
jgi:hypothetical protein